jgi:hypothetical protein
LSEVAVRGKHGAQVEVDEREERDGDPHALGDRNELQKHVLLALLEVRSVTETDTENAVEGQRVRGCEGERVRWS